MKLRGAVSVDIPIQKPNYEFVSIWSFKGKSFKDFAENGKQRHWTVILNMHSVAAFEYPDYLCNF